MPGMTGLFGRRCANAGRMKVFTVRLHVRHRQRRRLIRSFGGFIGKPFTAAGLKTKVREVLDESDRNVRSVSFDPIVHD
jgi:hypothetical protein